MNLMLVSVSERRQEIGLRMAIGARRGEIGLQFLIEAGLLALLGCGAGVLLALAGALAFGVGPAIWNPLTGMTILAAIAAATLITVISALYPARKAAQLDPADALAQDPDSSSQDRSKRLIQAFTPRTNAWTIQVTESAKVQPGNSPRETGRAQPNTERHFSDPMQMAHAAPRCTATSKRTGKPCRAPAVRGWHVCRMHGAREVAGAAGIEMPSPC
jgi:FtsX-like permease family